MSPRTTPRHRERKTESSEPPQKPTKPKRSSKELASLANLLREETTAPKEEKGTLSSLGSSEKSHLSVRRFTCLGCKKEILSNEVYGYCNAGDDAVCSRDCDKAYKNKDR